MDGRSPEDAELDAYTSGYDALEDGCRSEWDNPILVCAGVRDRDDVFDCVHEWL